MDLSIRHPVRACKRQECVKGRNLLGTIGGLCPPSPPWRRHPSRAMVARYWKTGTKRTSAAGSGGTLTCSAHLSLPTAADNRRHTQAPRPCGGPGGQRDSILSESPSLALWERRSIAEQGQLFDTVPRDLAWRWEHL
jgi:hypothetical protein